MPRAKECSVSGKTRVFLEENRFSTSVPQQMRKRSSQKRSVATVFAPAIERARALSAADAALFDFVEQSLIADAQLFGGENPGIDNLGVRLNLKL